MSNETWENQENIFHKALRLTGEKRESFLLKACAGNGALRSEIKSLLAAFENEARFLDESAFENHLMLLHKFDSKVLENSEIGSYRIRSRIGEGGMGKVFDATDMRLNRRVALKFLSDSFDDDKLAKRRLLREAQAAAMLDHPNICAIYGIEQTQEHDFIAMQFIDGGTLADFIKESPVDPKAVREIFRQIVSAVAFAHSHGIIHRDLKPANIMIKADGQIKVLDFGLAKNVGPKNNGSLSSRITQNGLIIGTVSYMSPEQLRGEKLDFQTDIFSMGIILCELISGKNPFARGSQAETIAAVLGGEPDLLTSLDYDSSSDDLVAVACRCLEKDKAKRFQSTAEILVQLENFGLDRIKRPRLRTKRKAQLVAAALIFLVLLILVATIYLSPRVNASRSLAVLPISNQTGDPANDYLSDGLTDSLTTRLSGLSQLRVTPPTLVTPYKSRDFDAVAFGKELNVEVLVQGSIVRSDDSLFLQIVLVKTRGGETLGTPSRFMLGKNDLINAQELVAAVISSNLQVVPTEQELELLRKRQLQNPEAGDNFFRARYYLNNPTKENVDKAMTFFNQAIESEPLYAKAWAGLAEAYILKSLPAYGSLTPGEAMLRAKGATDKALELDGDLCEAHTSKGIIQLRYNWNWIEAEKSFLKAIELNPGYAPAHHWYSRASIIKGDFDKALAEANKAKELEPLSPNSENNIARIYYYRRQDDKAIQTLSKILQENLSDKNAAYLLGLTYLQEGRNEDALGIFAKFYESNKLYFAAPLGYTYGRLNREGDALKILADLDEIAKKDIVAPQERALIYLGIGENEKAFELFTRSCHDRFPALPFVLTEFFFDPLRKDKRFTDLKSCVTPLS